MLVGARFARIVGGGCEQLEASRPPNGRALRGQTGRRPACRLSRKRRHAPFAGLC
jgi:hypothetical protein